MNATAMVEETSPKTKARLIGGTWGQNLGELADRRDVF